MSPASGHARPGMCGEGAAGLVISSLMVWPLHYPVSVCLLDVCKEIHTQLRVQARLCKACFTDSKLGDEGGVTILLIIRSFLIFGMFFAFNSFR